jgi:23S rRNA (adenine2503-C2)-methyltransferase
MPMELRMVNPAGADTPPAQEPAMDNIKDLTLEGLAAWLKSHGEPAFRARQVFQWLYQRQVRSFDEMSNVSKSLRLLLAERFTIGGFDVDTMAASEDGSRKFAFRLADGKRIESVLMPNATHYTLCLSTQVGCAMGCDFCMTARMGLDRNLTAGEIVQQVVECARVIEDGKILRNLVFMGMGEPFHNYDATLEAVDRLNDPRGFNFGARRITISTVGLVPMIERFAAEKRQVNLAVSLHAATDELRGQLLPINRKYPLAKLFAAVRGYYAVTRRRVTFEWALIEGKNDTPEQARALASWAKGLPCHVNVIPLNPTRDYAGQATTRERAGAFKAALESHGIPCTIRVRRGLDINAGCGQLAVEDGLKRPAPATALHDQT